MDRLKGKVAAITGGASGIGAGTVRRFVEEGAKVLIADLDETKGDALAAELGPASAFLRTDVSKEDDIVAMVAETTDRFGRIDVLFNNAGFGGALGPIESTTVADYDLTMDVLLKSVFLGIKHVTPLMKAQGSGSIISTASVAGIRAGYAPHLYSVAKCAVIHLTRTVALELGEHGIRVNAICPGFIATPLAAGRPDADETQIDQLRVAGAASQVLGRVGEPLDIANMALFLASDDSPWVTGQDFVVDGGFEAGPPWSRWPKFARMERPIRHHRPPDR
jgi:NAD(P)-dependent dehydrogenase (short-subunit alcohol dehydrogenase family)